MTVPTPLALLWLDARLALRNILRQPRRSLTAIAAIGFGIISLMLAAGYIEWSYWSIREESTTNQIGHIQITRPGYHQDGLSDPFSYLLPGALPGLEKLAALPQVKHVSPRLAFNGLISHGENTLSFIGEGIDPDKDPYSRNILVVEGQLLAADDPRGIVLGAGLAANLGVKTGDTIVLLSNAASGGFNAVEGKVRGLISTSMKDFDDNMLRVDIGLARQLLRTEGAHLWVTTLKETEQTERVMDNLAGTTWFAGLEVTPWNRLADYYNKTVELFSRQVAVVNIIIGVIIVLGISNTMTMSVMERTREIGTAMALGLRRRRIMSLFLIEGTLLGLLAGLLGVLLGYLLAQFISHIGIPMPPAPGMSRGYTGHIIITPGIALDALLLAVSTTLLASVYPAWRASRMIIVDALRHNR
ncbi:MAG: FtsX-like permease family protein [Pseudomonadota bacterium]